MRYVRSVITLTYVLIDIVLLGFSFLVPHYAYYHHVALVESKIHLLVYAVWLIMTVLLFYGFQLYFTIREISIWREIRRVFRAFLFSTFSTTLLMFFLKVQTFSRLVLIENIGFGLIALIVWRIGKRFFVQYLVAHGFNNWNVLVVGAGRMGKKFVDVILHRPQLGFRIVGFLDDHVPSGTLLTGRPVLGTLNDFESTVRRYFVDQIFVTIPSERRVVSEIGIRAKLLGIALQIVPDNFELGNGELRLHTIGDIPLLEYHSPSPNYQMIIIKRLMDVVVSSIALLFLTPIFLFFAVAIKWDDPGPVFYVSKRWGKKGRLFRCYKFRSMVHNAHKLREQLESANEMDGPVFKMKNDPRITRIGRRLRKYSVDELPQLWNVLKGDMSLVGPRPLPESEEVGEYKLEYLHRLSIKPGLTCLWQIHGRNRIPFKRWMRLDAYYIRNWSPQMDIGILMKTVPAVLKGKGAY